MNQHWIAMLERFRQRYGDKFVPPSANGRLTQYYGTGQRVEVTTTYASGNTWVRRGTIGITTGWKPALLLMGRRGQIGSGDTLSATDIVTATIDNRGRRHPL